MNEMPRGSAFEDVIADNLEAASVPFQRQASIQGLIVDFLVRRAGTRIVIEVKSWLDPAAQLARALHQAARIKELTGVDRVFLAIAGLPRSDNELGVLTPDDVGSSVATELERLELAHLRET